MNITPDQLAAILSALNQPGQFTSFTPPAADSDGDPWVRTSVIVRGERSGVFVGTVDSRPDRHTIRLTECRHVWSWGGALNVVDLARVGPSGGKITAPHPLLVEITDVIEVCDLTSQAIARFDAVAPWKS